MKRIFAALLVISVSSLFAAAELKQQSPAAGSPKSQKVKWTQVALVDEEQKREQQRRHKMWEKATHQAKNAKQLNTIRYMDFSERPELIVPEEESPEIRIISQVTHAAAAAAAQSPRHVWRPVQQSDQSSQRPSDQRRVSKKRNEPKPQKLSPYQKYLLELEKAGKRRAEREARANAPAVVLKNSFDALSIDDESDQE